MEYMANESQAFPTAHPMVCLQTASLKLTSANLCFDYYKGVVYNTGNMCGYTTGIMCGFNTNHSEKVCAGSTAIRPITRNFSEFGNFSNSSNGHFSEMPFITPITRKFMEYDQSLGKVISIIDTPLCKIRIAKIIIS